MNDKYNKIIQKYSNDPIGWIEDSTSFSGLEYNGLTKDQKKICKNLVKHKRICVSSGGGVGKTALDALLILWFLFVHPGSRCLLTAPNADQTDMGVWSELRKWLTRNKYKSLYKITTKKLYIVGHPEWCATRKTVLKEKGKISGKMSGLHAGYLLIICDEGADIPDSTYTALEGAMTNKHAYMIITSNPVSYGGYYYDTITDPKGKGAGFKVLFFDSRKSPLVTREYEKRIIARYGKDSPMYRAKVLGKPINKGDCAVVIPKTYDKVISTHKDYCEGDVVLGVDIGGGEGKDSDPTIYCHRIGNSFVKWDERREKDPDIIVAEIDDIMNKLYKKYKGIYSVAVVVDGIGVGAAVVTGLEKISNRWYKVVNHKGSYEASNPDMFINSRSEIYYRVHKNFEFYQFPVPPPIKLKKELANLFLIYSKGPISMETKKKFVSKMGMSPDNADAMSLTEAVYVHSKRIKFDMSKESISVLNDLNRFKRTKRKNYGRFGKFI